MATAGFAETLEKTLNFRRGLVSKAEATH
jgi:hypothetical protein